MGLVEHIEGGGGEQKDRDEEEDGPEAGEAEVVVAIEVAVLLSVAGGRIGVVGMAGGVVEVGFG